MTTKDIVGAAPGSKHLGAFHSVTRKDFIDPNDIKDIEGARPNTIQRGVRTVRVTDPQNPNYKLPGATEIPNADNNPYGGSSMEPRFIAAKKASEAREKALKQQGPVRPQTTTAAYRDTQENVVHALNIQKPSQDEVKSNKGFSLKLDPAHPKTPSERPPSSAKSGGARSSANGSKLSMAQKLDSFINK